MTFYSYRTAGWWAENINRQRNHVVLQSGSFVALPNVKQSNKQPNN